MQAETEPAARHLTVVQQLRHHAIERRSRNREHHARRTQGRHAQQPALCTEDRSSFFGAAEADIKGDPLLDPAPGAAVPLRTDRADEAQPGNRCSVRVSAELLGLAPGMPVIALCKATAVRIAREDTGSKANVLAGTVSRVARALSDAGISFRGLSAAAVGRKFVAHLAVDSAEDAKKATSILKRLG